MDRNAFRKICADGRRRPINKVIYESWCYVIRTLSELQVEKLVENKEKLQRQYMEVCETSEYLYLLKVPDKKAVYARIDAVRKLVEKFI